MSVLIVIIIIRICVTHQRPVWLESGEGAKPGTCLGVWAETLVLGAGQTGCNPC